jgi:hypothetical protein
MLVRRARVVGTLTLVVIAGCAPEPADGSLDAPSGGKAAAAPLPARSPVAREPGAMAERHEAQESFDRARAAVLAKDFATSARELAEASAFLRTHAEEAELGAIAALQGASKELEMVAQRLARGESQTVRTLDRVFANANRAEAQHHLTRAVAAMQDRDYRRAGEELVMSIDHLERAARDLRHPRDADAEPALASARSLAEHMLRGGVPTRAEAKRVTAQLDAELRRLCGIIDAEAAACALEAVR